MELLTQAEKQGLEARLKALVDAGVGLGLAFVLTFKDSFSMALGTLFFWFAGRQFKAPESFGRRVFVDNQETLSAGIIAGGSIIGILLILAENVFLAH